MSVLCDNRYTNFAVTRELLGKFKKLQVEYYYAYGKKYTYSEILNGILDGLPPVHEQRKQKEKNLEARKDRLKAIEDKYNKSNMTEHQEREKEKTTLVGLKPSGYAKLKRIKAILLRAGRSHKGHGDSYHDILEIGLDLLLKSLEPTNTDPNAPPGYEYNKMARGLLRKRD